MLALVYAALCVASLVPFVAVANPPIGDFANHAARLDLACHRDSALVSAMYSYHLGIIPDLAADLVNLPLCGRVAAATVLKLVTACALAVIYLSGWLIQRRLFGRANAFLLMFPALAFNNATTMGYINFFAGLACVMLMTALALGVRQRFRPLLILCNAAGVIIFFCHLFALAVAMLVIFGLFLAERPVSPRALFTAGWRTLACFAAPMLLLALVPTGGHDLTIAYGGKVRTLSALFLAQQHSIGTYGLVLAAPLYLLIRERLAAIAPLLAKALVLLAFYVLIVPNQISDAVDIDARTFVALAYLLFAALRPVRRVRELSIGIAAVSALFVTLQLWAMVTAWQPFSRQVDEFRASLGVLPANARVFVVSADGGGPRMIAHPLAYSHVTSYATMDRRIFNPLEFTGAGMQPLSVTPAFADVDTPVGPPVPAPVAEELTAPDQALTALARQYHFEYALRWPARFDYVDYYHYGKAPNFDPARLQAVHVGSFFSILKVKRSPAEQPQGATASPRS